MSNDRPELPILVAGLRAVGRERMAPKAHLACIYARVSSQEQESIPVQLEQSRRYAASLGLPVVAEFSEEQSGLDATRPEYRRLLDMARRGAFSHVIVFHSSRWGREPGEYLTAFHELTRLGIEIHATSLGKLDPSTAWVHAGVSYMASRDISTHVLPTMVARAQAGLEMGKPHYGYRRTLVRGVREPHPEQFPIVQELFRRAAAGESIYSLTQWFNATTGQRRRLTGLRRLLSDPYYAGLYVWNRTRNSKIDGQYAKPRDEWVWAAHPHPAVDMDSFAAIGQRLSLNAHIGQERTAGAQFALAGLLWCAACTQRMHGQRGGKKRWGFYLCPRCGKSRSLRRVHGTLARLLAALPQDPAEVRAMLADEARRGQGDQEAGRRAAQREQDKLRARLVRLTELYADGALSSSDYQAARASTQEQLTTLDAAAAPARSGQDRAAVNAAAAWLPLAPLLAGQLDVATPAEANLLYRALFSRVEIDMAAGRLRVRWLPGLALLAGADVQETALG